MRIRVGRGRAGCHRADRGGPSAPRAIVRPRPHAALGRPIGIDRNRPPAARRPDRSLHLADRLEARLGIHGQRFEQRVLHRRRQRDAKRGWRDEAIALVPLERFRRNLPGDEAVERRAEGVHVGPRSLVAPVWYCSLARTRFRMRLCSCCRTPGVRRRSRAASPVSNARCSVIGADVAMQQVAGVHRPERSMTGIVISMASCQGSRPPRPRRCCSSVRPGCSSYQVTSAVLAKEVQHRHDPGMIVEARDLAPLLEKLVRP